MTKVKPATNGDMEIIRDRLARGQSIPVLQQRRLLARLDAVELRLHLRLFRAKELEAALSGRVMEVTNDGIEEVYHEADGTFEYVKKPRSTPPASHLSFLSCVQGGVYIFD